MIAPYKRPMDLVPTRGHRFGEDLICKHDGCDATWTRDEADDCPGDGRQYERPTKTTEDSKHGESDDVHV